MNIYRTALNVQDASNPSGVILSLANEVLPAIREEAGYKEQGTAYLAHHPVLVLFLDKLASLSGHWMSGDDVMDYFDHCKTMAEKLEALVTCGKCGATAPETDSYQRYRSDAPLCQPCENGEREADAQEVNS